MEYLEYLKQLKMFIVTSSQRLHSEMRDHKHMKKYIYLHLLFKEGCFVRQSSFFANFTTKSNLDSWVDLDSSIGQRYLIFATMKHLYCKKYIYSFQLQNKGCFSKFLNTIVHLTFQI